MAASWNVVGATVRGAVHRNKNMPNQDYFLCSCTPPVCTIVSDGHGFAKHFRSEAGSKAASDILLKIISDWNGDLTDSTVEHLKSRIVNTWIESTDEHLAKNPFESDGLYLSLPESLRAELKERPRDAYGCTLLCAAAADDAVLLLQLGDGNILLLFEDGETRTFEEGEIVATPKERLDSTTDSLCRVKSPSEIYHLVLKGFNVPMAISVSSDGIFDSFSIDNFMKVPVNCVSELVRCEYNHVRTRESLYRLLNSITENGAGDDTTLSLMYDMNRVSAWAEKR
jgi:serine/threonine protein phosphatase PrpC